MLAEADQTHQYSAHHRHLQNYGHNVKQHAVQQETDALGSAVNRPRQPARLLSEVEVQVEAQEMVKDVAGNLADRRLGHRHKNCIAQLLKNGAADAREAIC